MLDFFGYAGGLVMGFTLGLLGGGGSILAVPIFVYLFRLAPTVATGYSLCVVGIAASIGAYRNHCANTIQYRTGLLFAIPSFLGVFSARVFLLPSLPEVIFESGAFSLSKDSFVMLVFALVMSAASYSMIRGRKNDAPIKLQSTTRNIFIAMQGLIVGTTAGFVGAGGGFLIVPALVLFSRLPMKEAIGTSLFIIALQSLVGFSGEVAVNKGSIDWSFLAIFACLSIVGILMGTFATKFISGDKLKKGFGFFVLVMAVFILYQQLG